MTTIDIPRSNMPGPCAPLCGVHCRRVLGVLPVYRAFCVRQSRGLRERFNGPWCLFRSDAWGYVAYWRDEPLANIPSPTLY